MIIYDEHEYCNFLLENKFSKVRQMYLNFLAKYWYEQGFNKTEIDKKLQDWWKSQDKYFNYDLKKKFIKKALLHTKHYRLRNLVSITVTEGELKAIRSVEDYRLQKILFIMLVTARFFKYTETRIKPKNTPTLIGTYFNQSLAGALKAANVVMTRKERKETRKKLYDLGFIDSVPYTKNIYKSETSYRLNYSDETGVPVFSITDWRNPIAYFQEYCGEKIIKCCECGKMVLKRGKNHSICNQCWKKKLNYVRKTYDEKYREKIKTRVFETSNCDDVEEI